MESCRRPPRASPWLSSLTGKRMAAGSQTSPRCRAFTAYGRARKQATAAVQALALRLIADRLEHGEAVPRPHERLFCCRLKGNLKLRISAFAAPTAKTRSRTLLL